MLLFTALSWHSAVSLKILQEGECPSAHIHPSPIDTEHEARPQLSGTCPAFTLN